MDPALAIEAAAMSQQTHLKDVTARGDSEVQRFYKDSVVFLTGGSGFLGKQLIEKLFRSCSISKMLMLLRAKKGKNVMERLQQILEDPVFDTLRKDQPDFSDKIMVVEGDMAELRLGIKSEDWETITEEAHVIFHGAATTKFDETLKVATLINMRGTREAIALGKACKNLRSFVHVSTAYAHATTQFIGKELKEEHYKAPVPPETMISMAENIDADRLTRITKEMIKDWPNTYAFTKSISEELVCTEGVGLPICIVKPAIVICSYREPSPGWLDLSCVYGASGILLGLYLGVLHVILVNPDVKLGFIPCDYVNNTVIVAGRETATSGGRGRMGVKIYCVASTQRNPTTWGQSEVIVRTKSKKIPSPSAVYYNDVVTTANYWVFVTLFSIFHILPAFIADFVCVLIGKQRRFAKAANKVFRMCTMLSCFLLNEWQFNDDNLDALYKSQSKTDKLIFNFDVTSIDWAELILIWSIGTRKYIIKDGLKNTEYALKKQKILRVAHYILATLYIYAIWKCISVFIFIVYYCFNFIYHKMMLVNLLITQQV